MPVNTLNRYQQLQLTKLTSHTVLPRAARKEPPLGMVRTITEAVPGYTLLYACVNYAITEAGEVFRLTRRGAVPVAFADAQRVIAAAHEHIRHMQEMEYSERDADDPDDLDEVAGDRWPDCAEGLGGIDFDEDC